MDFQRELDIVYSALVSGEISRRSYVRQIDDLGERHPRISGRFSYRRDMRSLGRFALGLYDTTLRERFLVESAWPSFASPGDRLEDLGINNDGRLVLDTQGRRSQLDFRVVRADGSSHPLEVKYGPTQKFLTYKLDDLSNYLATDDAVVLTVACPDAMVGPNGDPDREASFELPRGSFFMLKDHRALGTLISIGETGCHRGFGGKPTVRVYNRQFREIADVRTFSEEIIHA